ncbi:MAG: hydroxyacid dehydrogenase [Desulfurococcales archaeon ex4484_42]|nr:MAG: hydroxyacid dehydrogenase [Desulfurococcales archaeon ex4484_42]
MDKPKLRIAVVNSKSFGKYSDALEKLKSIGDVDILEFPRNIDGGELAEKLEGYHFLIVSATPYFGRDFFKNNRSVVMLIRHGVGLDNVDLKAAEEHGVIVVKVPGEVEREAVAELTITLILSALRMVPQAYESVRKGKWYERVKYIGKELKNLVVGIIGFGNIGSRVAEILIRGFNSKVLVYDPFVKPGRVSAIGAIPTASLDELLKESDIITIHAALTPETYHLINWQAFSKMKKGVIIVNTARGEIIDTNALIRALEEGIVSAVALDVIENEPIDNSHPILRFKNVIVTPHIAAYTYESLHGMDYIAVEAIESYLKGRPIRGAVVMPKNPRRLVLEY